MFLSETSNPLNHTPLIYDYLNLEQLEVSKRVCLEYARLIDPIP